jgi:phage terminase large subunit-like protein
MAEKKKTTPKGKTQARSSTPPDPPTQYALDVVSGKELAGPLVRLACQRHLNDLKSGSDRGLKWEWTLRDGSAPRGTGKYVANFFASELLLQVDERVEPFLLAPPLAFIIGSIYGWKGPDGNRRFRIAYVEIGKGNAKTTLGGGMLLYMGIADGEMNADCYTAAVDKDQAKIPFKDAVNFVNRNQRLDSVLKRSGGEGQEWNLAYLKTGSFMRPISSDTKGRGKSGFRPHFVLLDELHEHPTSAMVDLAEANLKTRRQPLVFKITNSGVVDPGTVCYQTHEHGQRMLEGIDPNDDSRFFYICGLDKGDSYLDSAIRKKANPMYGIIPRMERYLDDQIATAKGMPSKVSVVRRLNFCEWVESADPWIEKEVWDANAGRVDIESLKGRPCYGGLDLSKRDDLTALVLVFPNEDGTKDVLVFAWTPAEGIADREHRDKTPYQHWISEGCLLTTPGKTIDYDFVAAKIGELVGTYDIQAIAFDHWHFPEMERALNQQNISVNVLDHPQGFQGMNPSIEAAEQDLVNGLVRHGGNPLLTACVFNVKVIKNAEALRMFEKKDPTKRIDAAQSFVMAEGILHGADPGASYEVTII